MAEEECKQSDSDSDGEEQIPERITTSKRAKFH